MTEDKNNEAWPGQTGGTMRDKTDHCGAEGVGGTSGQSSSSYHRLNTSPTRERMWYTETCEDRFADLTNHVDTHQIVKISTQCAVSAQQWTVGRGVVGGKRNAGVFEHTAKRANAIRAL